jgi:hypothetical protein
MQLVSFFPRQLRLNRPTGDSYTRHLGHANIRRLYRLSGVLMLCGLI